MSAISESVRRRRLARRGVGLLLRPGGGGPLGRRVRARGGVGRLSGGWRHAALELDPGRPRRGRRAGARARAPTPASGRSSRDPSSAGELTTTFAIEGERDRIAQRLEYRLVSGGPFAWLTDRAVHPLPGAGIDAPVARPPRARAGRRIAFGAMFVFKAAVLGAGTMGGEIAQVIASADIPVVMKDVKQDLVDAGLEKAREVTEGQLASLVAKEKISSGAGRRAPRGDPGADHRNHRVRGLRRRRLRDRGRARADGDQAGGVRRARRGQRPVTRSSRRTPRRSRSPRSARPPRVPTRSSASTSSIPPR